MRPAKKFRAAREAFRRSAVLFVSVDEKFFSFLTGFIVQYD